MNIFSGENLINLIKGVGLFGVFFIVFAESGLFFGFFLPGDSLLFTAGVLASQGVYNIWALIGICFLGAVLGDNVGYTFGKKVGPKIFSKEDSLLFKKSHLLKAKKFYEKYGSKTIILARFVPIVRTFAPIVAGAGEMQYKTFVLNNLVGGAIWTFSMPLAGYVLGRSIDVDKYLLPVVFLIILISLLPALYELVMEKRKQKKEKEKEKTQK
jgi:membrane-associated protein